MLVKQWVSDVIRHFSCYRIDVIPTYSTAPVFRLLRVRFWGFCAPRWLGWNLAWRLLHANFYWTIFTKFSPRTNLRGRGKVQGQKRAVLN